MSHFNKITQIFQPALTKGKTADFLLSNNNGRFEALRQRYFASDTRMWAGRLKANLFSKVRMCIVTVSFKPDTPDFFIWVFILEHSFWSFKLFMPLIIYTRTNLLLRYWFKDTYMFCILTLLINSTSLEELKMTQLLYAGALLVLCAASGKSGM